MNQRGYEEAISELARFLKIDYEEVHSRAISYRPETLAEEWRVANPKTPEEIKNFYKSTDNYFYDLLMWNYLSPVYQQEIAPLLHYHGQKILEIGGGIGTLSIALAYGGNEVTYFDISPKLRDFAVQRFNERRLNINIINSMKEAKKDYYDIVIAQHSLEYIHPDELKPLFIDIASTLKSTGFLYYRPNFNQQAHPPTPNINTASYWDRIWSIEGENTWRKYPLTFKRVASYIEPKETVLDVGCGIGIFLNMMRPHCKEVAGLDISPVAINTLESKGIKGKVGELPQICFPDKSFDVVVATEVVEHLDNPAMFLREAIRVARKKVIFSVPDNVLGYKEEIEHRQIFSKPILEEILRQFFDDFQIENFSDTFPTPNQTISLPTLLAICKVNPGGIKSAIKPIISKPTIFPMQYNHSEYFNKLAKEAGLESRANRDLVKSSSYQGVRIAMPILEGKMDLSQHFSLGLLKKPRGTVEMTQPRKAVDVARNFLSENLDKDWIFYYDADVNIPAETLVRLLKWDLPVVTGLVVMRAGFPEPQIYKYYYKEGKGYWYLPKVEEVYAYMRRHEQDLKNMGAGCGVIPCTREELIPCDAVGADCLLVHRKVLESIEKPYFKCTEGTASQEDFYFCRKVRDAGFDIYCDPGVLCGHNAFYERNWKHFLSWAGKEPYPWEEG